MSAAASFLPRYTPAQLEAHRRNRAIRERLGCQASRKQFIFAAPEPAPAPKPVAALPKVLTVTRLPNRRTLKEKSERILALVCRQHGVTPDDIFGWGRVRHVLLARQQYTWLMYRFTSISLAKIGELLDRDHTTLMSQLRAYAALRPHKRSYPCKRFTYSKDAQQVIQIPVVKKEEARSQRRWAEKEIQQVLALAASGMNRKEIGRRMGRTVGSVREALRRAKGAA